MDFDLSDWGVTLLLVILVLSVLIAVIVIAKTFINDAKENKAKASLLAAEEKKLARESQASAKPQPQVNSKPQAKPATAPPVPHKDDVSDDDDLVAAAEVYLTYELKDQAITSLEKHLLTNPTDEKALALLKKAEASD